tara:strand:- start:479 stop:634 length:156 start_codon:yes stop_codon:yes gene_type:complete
MHGRLQDQVTDLERDAATPSAILEPSVGVILVAHSMGYVRPAKHRDIEFAD